MPVGVKERLAALWNEIFTGRMGIRFSVIK
jgi:hypothetical protein